MPVKEHYHHGALRETLLAEALATLERDGLQGLSLRKLAESAGVSKTAPYRHFADKQELLTTIAAEGFAILADRLAAALPDRTEEETASPGAGIRLLFRAYLDFARERPALYRLMFSRLGFSLHSDACRVNSERALGYLFSAVVKSQANGWRAGQDIHALVLSLWASVHGWAQLLMDDLLPEGFADG